MNVARLFAGSGRADPLADVTGSSDLVPPPDEASRPPFLRWLVFLVANLYPTFTYADDPARFVPGETAQQGFRENVDRYAKRLWGQAEATAGDPWFLGERFSALDIYVAVMTRWRPRAGMKGVPSSAVPSTFAGTNCPCQ